MALCRDGDLILHDSDADLAVLDPDWPAILEGLRRRLPRKYVVKGAVQVQGVPQLTRGCTGPRKPFNWHAAVVSTKEEQPPTVWLRIYCPLGFLDFSMQPIEGARCCRLA